MYCGFNLSIGPLNDEFYRRGMNSFNSYSGKVREELDEYLLDEKILNGTQMQNNWFPSIEADVFISHSHKDVRDAITLAGALEANLGIKTFIDSCVWGYANDLLKEIDNKYCRNTGKNSYSYEMRNYSTSHVHNMLSSALSMMIDKSEVLFFLNSENSITTRDTIQKTESPWIYSEIAISSIIRKKSPAEHRSYNRQFSIIENQVRKSKIQDDLKVEYELPIDHLINIDLNIINKWIENHNGNDYPLDSLYRTVHKELQ